MVIANGQGNVERRWQLATVAQKTSERVPAEPLNHLSSVRQDTMVTARAPLIKDRKLGLITANWEENR